MTIETIASVNDVRSITLERNTETGVIWCVLTIKDVGTKHEKNRLLRFPIDGKGKFTQAIIQIWQTDEVLKLKEE